MDIGRQSPTVSVIIPYQHTKGDEAVELYNATNNTMHEWQVALLYDIMGENDDGLWAHQKFGYSVPRRNGKSEMVLVRSLWGLKNGEHILYTAHRTSTAHAVWTRLERLCEKADIELSSSYRAFGKEHLYAKDGGEIEFRTRTSTGALGEGYDLLIVDEAQEYTIDQETALKYIVTDSPNPQTIMLGTPPTAISAGTVFVNYREQVLTGRGYDSGWAEWSVPEMSDPENVDLWYETNPSLGCHLTERTIRAELPGINDDGVDFNIQRLGLWLKYNQKSAISRTEWESLAIEDKPKLKGPLYMGVKFGHDTSNVSVSVAVKTDDDKIFVEAVDCRPYREGVEWIVDLIRSADVKAVGVDGDSGKQILIDTIKRAKIRPIPQAFKTGDVVTACGLFEQGIETATICHSNQPALTQVVSNCEHRHIGNGGGFGYKSQLAGADISLLESATIAHMMCVESRETKKQSISY